MLVCCCWCWKYLILLAVQQKRHHDDEMTLWIPDHQRGTPANPLCVVFTEMRRSKRRMEDRLKQLAAEMHRSRDEGVQKAAIKKESHHKERNDNADPRWWQAWSSYTSQGWCTLRQVFVRGSPHYQIKEIVQEVGKPLQDAEGRTLLQVPIPLSFSLSFILLLSFYTNSGMP